MSVGSAPPSSCRGNERGFTEGVNQRSVWSRTVLVCALIGALLLAGESAASELRTLRLAVSVTDQMRRLIGDVGSGTSQTEAEIADLVSQLNAISIPEIGVAFELVPNNAVLISTDASDAAFLRRYDPERSARAREYDVDRLEDRG